MARKRQITSEVDMGREINGWAVVAPNGEICGFALTKRAYLNMSIKSKVHKQVWKREALGKDTVNWSGELKLIVPRTFREVWPAYYKKGFRFVRARETVVLLGPSNG